MVINPITPETETSAHFWIGWARDFALDDDALTERAKAENTQVIQEDVRVIEGQQRVLSARPGLSAVPINADGALAAVHKMLERLAAR
jgi:vanillate O-demethylase monooxygenase subunit